MKLNNQLKILPVSYPTITSWTWHANLFAMIEHIPEARDWIFSNYIQIQCRPDAHGEGKLYFEFFPFYRAIFDCPALHTQYIDRKLVNDKWKNIRDFLVYCIDNDYYVYCVCNEKYMLHCDEDCFHEIFIFGYDLLKQSFNCADFTFTHSRKYSFVNVSFDEVCQGLIDVTENTDYLLRWEGGIVLAKVRQQKENKYELDLNYIRNNFQEYLNGINSYSHFGLFYNIKAMSQKKEGEPFLYHVFGIKVYDILAEYLKGITDLSKIDVRPFHNLYEHKKLMTKRIAYFENKGLLSCDGKWKDYFEIERECLNLCNAVIRYKIRGKSSTLVRMLNYMNSIKSKEEKQLAYLINELG